MPGGRRAALTSLAVMAAAFPIVLVATGQAGAGVHTVGATRSAIRAGGTWEPAREVPGMVALSRRGVAQINSVSCSSPGNCSAGGSYGGSPGTPTFGQPFVVSEVNGVWHRAIPVPGVRALNTRKNGFISSVSCTRPGDCSAGGRYVGPRGARPFVVDEVNGIWRKAITLSVSGVGDVQVSALACGSPGNCSAGGRTGSGGTTKGLDGTFVVNEVHGAWRKPVVIPGKLTFIYGGWVQSMACPTAGNCTAGGWYLDGADQFQAFVVSKVNGRWRNYITVPGTSPNHYGSQIASLSCPRPGDCTVAGNHDYADGFLASEVNGTWHKARSIPGLANFHTSEQQVTALSCRLPGDCSVGGWYHDSQGKTHAFVVSEVNGTWHNAIDVPGMHGLDPSGQGLLTALSCARPGDCSAGGYDYSAPYSRAFVVNEVNGAWHNAVKVPGISGLRPPGVSQVTALSCAGPGHCSAGGYYADTIFGRQSGRVFVVNER
jgi:hypothetical protein